MKRYKVIIFACYTLLKLKDMKMKKYAILSYEPTERIAYFSKMNFFIQTLWFYITIKRAINANIAGSPCFTIIDLLDVKPPKRAATTTHITKNN
ncbi:hypothetical protein DJ46_5512 [Bacillus anthracis str. Vollum]|uniref:Uncharacterized protein n=1 Tax=Bacillus thuringiensis TaxID=1428 RepID=A0AB33ARM4_BACTU|nr:hypothetical protein DJ44_4934 [Bacillus anthracis]AIK64058.1 hypothetical protein DJ46_5512 [Bacillus anthracis str. Vollum]AJG46057.1 hypothetical protein AS53_3088 [Bacillus anthracis str. Turkey32]AJG74249.1 hypothetical protein BF38_2301 [Bacillus thuringiensis]CUB41125.1 hypothetical protein BN2127_JRS4_03645 [Bacillus cereus]CUB58548.1 hypothetical protein BN2127_JRS10_04562 [Bacillus subtilis]